MIEGYCKHAKSGKTRAKHLQRLTTKQKLRKRHRRRPQQRSPRLRHGLGRLRRARVEDRAVVERAAGECPELAAALGSGRLELRSTGSDLPVIDLSRLAPDFVDAAAGCDLVVLQGMGRGIETNLQARFSCDALNMGLVKHPEVADKLGGELFDCVVHFREPDG